MPVDRLHAVGWDALLDRVGNGDPFRRSDVLTILAEGVPDVRVVAVGRAGRTAAAAVLAAGRRRGIRELRTLGPSVHLFDPDPPAEDREAADALVAALELEEADVLTLPEVRPGGEVAAALAARHRVHLRPEAPTFRVRADAPRGLPDRRREAGRLIRRAARRGVRVEVDTLAAWTDLRPELDAALALHRARWSGPDADPAMTTEPGRTLVRRMVETVGGDGRLRLTRIRHDGALVAFALAAVCPAGAVMYLMARDVTHPDASGLGATAAVTLIDALLAEGVGTVDLGAGGGVFKRHLAEPEEVATLQVPLTVAGRTFLTASAMRAVLRRGRAGERPFPRVGRPWT